MTVDLWLHCLQCDVNDAESHTSQRNVGALKSPIDVRACQNGTQGVTLPCMARFTYFLLRVFFLLLNNRKSADPCGAGSLRSVPRVRLGSVAGIGLPPDHQGRTVQGAKAAHGPSHGRQQQQERSAGGRGRRLVGASDSGVRRVARAVDLQEVQQTGRRNEAPPGQSRTRQHQ